jgi:hypothetical protein
MQGKRLDGTTENDRGPWGLDLHDLRDRIRAFALRPT